MQKDSFPISVVTAKSWYVLVSMQGAARLSAQGIQRVPTHAEGPSSQAETVAKMNLSVFTSELRRLCRLICALCGHCTPARKGSAPTARHVQKLQGLKKARNKSSNVIAKQIPGRHAFRIAGGCQLSFWRLVSLSAPGDEARLPFIARISSLHCLAKASWSVRANAALEWQFPHASAHWFARMPGGCPPSAVQLLIEHSPSQCWIWRLGPVGWRSIVGSAFQGQQVWHLAVENGPQLAQLWFFFVTRAPWGIKPSVTKTTKQSSAVRRVKPKVVNAGEMIKKEKGKREKQRNKPQTAKQNKQKPFPSRAKLKDTSRCGI